MEGQCNAASAPCPVIHACTDGQMYVYLDMMRHVQVHVVQGRRRRKGEREREREREKERARETQRHNTCQGAEGFASIRVAIAFSFNSFSLQTNAPQSTCLLNLVLSPSYLAVTTDRTSPFRSVNSNTDIDCNMSGTACGRPPSQKAEPDHAYQC